MVEKKNCDNKLLKTLTVINESTEYLHLYFYFATIRSLLLKRIRKSELKRQEMKRKIRKHYP